MTHPSLVEYGIHTEQSDVRVHVCPKIRRVYVYPTSSGIDAINSDDHRLVPGFQPGWDEPTAEGYLVPPEDIPFCVELRFRDSAWDALDFSEDDPTNVKGAKAVKLVAAMLRHGLLPLPAEPVLIEERDIQISGTDIFVRANQLREHDIRIQVKCDFRGGSRALGGTGYLYLQVRESNPYRLY